MDASRATGKQMVAALTSQKMANITRNVAGLPGQLTSRGLRARAIKDVKRENSQTPKGETLERMVRKKVSEVKGNFKVKNPRDVAADTLRDFRKFEGVRGVKKLDGAKSAVKSNLRGMGFKI